MNISLTPELEQMVDDKVRADAMPQLRKSSVRAYGFSKSKSNSNNCGC